MASGAKWDPRFAEAGRGVVTDVDYDMTSDEAADKFKEHISGKTGKRYIIISIGFALKILMSR